MCNDKNHVDPTEDGAHDGQGCPPPIQAPDTSERKVVGGELDGASTFE